MPRGPFTWAQAVAIAIAKRGGRAHLNRIYETAPRIYGAKPATVEAVIRQAIESHSSASENFAGVDWFKPSVAIGEGEWELRGTLTQVGEILDLIAGARFGVLGK